jgi:hypothetical protein
MVFCRQNHAEYLQLNWCIAGQSEVVRAVRLLLTLLRAQLNSKVCWTAVTSVLLI